jgi:uncharacterized protein (TIGR02594 family)
MATTYRVVSSSLNMRAGAGKGFPVVVTLPQHKVLDQIDVSDDGSWIRVQTTIMDGPPVEGWVSANNVSLQPIDIDLPADAPWLVLAEREMGNTAVPGTGDNPRIVEYLKTTPTAKQNDEEAWCAAFINWCMEQAGLEGTGDPAARSWLTWGKALAEPRQGCVTVLKRGNDPALGHVGFYVATVETKEPGSQNFEIGSIALLGGNQGRRVTVSSYPPERLLGWRWRP